MYSFLTWPWHFSAQGGNYRGGKNQAAIPTPAMHVLQVAPFSVSGECFASPLNCFDGGFRGTDMVKSGGEILDKYFRHRIL